MEFIREYYFDFNVMGDYMSPILDGFWLTLKLSILGGIFSLIWGLVLAVLRQLPGKPLAPVRWLTIGYIDVFRGIPLLIVLLLVSGGLSTLAAPIGGDVLPRLHRQADLVRRDEPVLVRGDLADDHLRRLHGRGLPGRDRIGARAGRWRRRARSG